MRTPNFSLARNYPQLQNVDVDPAVKTAIQQIYQNVYDLRDAIQYPSVGKVRTLDLNDTTVGNAIAHPVVVHGGGTVVLVAGVLHIAITADLTVRLNVVTRSSSNAVGIFTIPANQPVFTPITFASFTLPTLNDLDTLSWDVLASDGSAEANGVASFSVWWV